MIELFWDKETGGFYAAQAVEDTGLVRHREIYDGASPCGNSIALRVLFTLGRVTGKKDYEEKAHASLSSISGSIRQNPLGFTMAAQSLLFLMDEVNEIVVAGEKDAQETQAMLRALRGVFLPDAIVLLKQNGSEGDALEALAPFVREMDAHEGGVRAYLCRHRTCIAPFDNARELSAHLKKEFP